VSASEWSAEIAVEGRDPHVIDRLARTLGPEAGREVPRAKARLVRDSPTRLILHIATRDTGALRAALNTFLGWIELASATEDVAAHA
jgi:tRNA threonylcarbamoyladenosine modification (KEOPS) complex  Pcc1 subunit